MPKTKRKGRASTLAKTLLATGLKRILAGAAIGAFSSTVAYANNVHENYAVLFSGGYNAANNHLRYYEETLRMWNIATGLLDFDIDKVFALFADGTDIMKDRTPGEFVDFTPANWVNSNWSAITSVGGNINMATPGNLQTTLSMLSSTITPEDSFYFWSFNHGSNPSFANCPNVALNSPNSPILNQQQLDGSCMPQSPGSNLSDVLLTAWNEESISDAEFASWIDPINAKAEVYAFAQCFSGGMVDNLFPASNRFAAYSAAADRCSFLITHKPPRP